jgi:transposase
MKAKMDSDTASLAVIGVDIGKEVFHIVGLGVDGKFALRRKIRRLGLKDAFEKLPPSNVGMEACLSAHFVSRTLRALGHEPRIIPAIYTKPFVKGQKNDYNDAEAVARSSTAAEPACGPREEPRSTRSAGLSSRPFPIGLSANGDKQPDPSLSHRARYRCQGWRTRPS